MSVSADDTQYCYRHPKRETRVSCSECERPICEQCMSFAPVGIRCPEHAAVGRQKGELRRQARTAKHTVARSDAPATVTLVALNLLVYLITVAQGAGLSRPGGWLIENGALIGGSSFAGIGVADGEWWRLATSAFLHASVLHIAFNMFALYSIGSAVEQMLGTTRFLLVYAAAGLAGSAGALILSDQNAVTVGASGGIFGLLGALLIWEFVQTGSFAGQAMGLIVLNLALTFAIPNISVGGHIGGLIGGAAAAYALLRTRYMRPRWIGPGLAVGVAVLAVVVAAVRVESYPI